MTASNTSVRGSACDPFCTWSSVGVDAAFSGVVEVDVDEGCAAAVLGCVGALLLSVTACEVTLHRGLLQCSVTVRSVAEGSTCMSIAGVDRPGTIVIFGPSRGPSDPDNRKL